MRKRLSKGYLLIFLLWILYITAAVSFPKAVTFWIASGFCVPVFLAQVLTLHTMCRQELLMKDRIFDFPRLWITVCYTVVQLAASLLLMKFSDRLSLYAVVFIETAILLLSVIGFYAVEAASREVDRQNTRRQEDTAGIQRFQEQLNRLTIHCENEQIQKRLGKLAEEMRFCIPTSTQNAWEIEDEIAALLAQIEEVSLSADADTAFTLCDRVTALLKERDRICKTRR